MISDWRTYQAILSGHYLQMVNYRAWKTAANLNLAFPIEINCDILRPKIKPDHTLSDQALRTRILLPV